MTTDTLERLRAQNIASDDGPAPSFAVVLRRIEARPRSGGGSVAVTRPWWMRRAVPIGATLTVVLGVSLVVTSGGPGDGPTAPLGVLQAAAATAGENPAAGRFSGYVRDSRDTYGGVAGSPAFVNRIREVVRPVSGTEYEGRFETRQSTNPTPLISRWRRPYGTLFLGALRPGQEPSPAPTDPREVRAAIASWSIGRAPTGGDTELARHVREAYGDDDADDDGTELALGYATAVLTAPRVDPDVRAAAFEGLSRVSGIAVDPDATDPARRPAAALRSTSTLGPSTATFELFIDPDTARVLGTRNRVSVPAGTNDDLPKGQPPYGESDGASVYRYTD